MDTRVFIQLCNLSLARRMDDYSHHNPSDLFQASNAYDEQYSWDDGYGTESAYAPAFRRPLSEVATRLDLLGHTIHAVGAAYERYAEFPSSANQPRFPPRPPYPPFDALVEALHSLDVCGIPASHSRFGEGNPWRGAADRLVALVGSVPDGHSGDELRDWYEIVLSGIDPYDILQILAQSAPARGFPVTWHPFNEDTYSFVSPEMLELGAKRRQKFLIVTEGNSDTMVIRRALELLQPEVADFYGFIDMDKNYPLTGTGNLHNFYQGLVKIGILNNVLFVYDNDTEGSLKHVSALTLPAPVNVRVMKLPSLPEFSDFSTIGPTGEQPADINGLAVSIECFLDLAWKNDRPARVRWTGFNYAGRRYQGELEGKQEYVRRFLELDPRHSDSTTPDGCIYCSNGSSRSAPA